MGLDTRRPPLPAPTESTDETSGPDTEVGTTLTTRTDKTSYSIPEDGSPITISTHKINAGREGGLHHRRQKSQTSLLIEYFETSKSGDKSKNRPSVRVKVTPSGTKKHPAARGAVQITGIGSDRKPSYTRRISLRNTSAEQDTSPDEDADLGYSPQATSSRRAPVEIEVLQDGSEISTAQSSRGLLYAPIDSNISSMPPDSMLDGNYQTASDVSQFPDNDDESTVRDADFLNAPLRDRSRSVSRERLTQKVMEKLNASSSEQKASPSSREKGTKDYEYNSPRRERRTRARKDSRPDDDVFSGAESSLLSSSKSYRSGSSQASRVTNNPKLLEMVEDTIKRVILPEINALKADQKVQKTERNLQSFDEHRRVHSKSSDYETSDLQRQVSKSSSSPNIASRPKVVLNREGDDPGTVLSRGDSERKKVRRPHRDERSEHRSSSRRSSGKHSRRSSYDTEERSVRRVSRDENEGGKAVAAAIAGGGLTAAALKHHDSQTDMHERRKMRSKSRGSRSRSASLAEPVEEPPARKGVIPPLPLASRINDSEVTRDSILSGGSDRAHLRNSGEAPAIMREVSRGSLRDAITPGSIRTPTRTSVTRTLEKDYFTRDSASPGSPAGSHGKARSKSRTAALAKTVEERHMDADGYGSPTSPRKLASPAQSVSSLKKHFEDEPLVPQSLKLRGASSRSGGRLHDLKASQSDFRSDESLPTAKLASSRQQSRDASGDEFITPLEHSFADNEPESVHTPGEETANAWFDRQRAVNDRYRDSMGESNRDSYQTNPYPQDERSFSYADDARRKQLDDDDNEEYADENAVHSVQVKHGLDHRFVPSPVDVESAVASLLDPSTVDSNRVSTSDSPALQNGSYSNRMAEQLRALGKDSPGIYEGSTISQTIPSQDRWAALRGKATGLADVAEHGSATHSPAQSPAKEFRESFEEQPKMHASGLPLADDPMPEIGHYDSQSDLTTNPSIIQGPLGGDPTGKESWPYTPEADRAGDLKHNHSEQSMRGTAITGAALAGAGVALVGASSAGAGRQVMEEDEPQRSTPDLGRNRTAALKRDVQPSRSPTALRNDNYARDTQDLPRDVLTPSGEPMYKKEDLEEYEAAMNAHDGESISTSQAPRHYRANSHGMASPLYDSATGNGIDRIQSKDIVALMDHLTVRDAQRNARDTEMLVALVRSAAEMRQSFDEMKRFIAEQDKLIMRQAGRVGEQTAQKVLSGPRPQPTASPRTPQRTLQEDTQTKRKGVLRRALQGLTGGKGPKDLAKIEDMLMQILDNVEDLKHQGGPRPSGASFDNASLDSYERSRAAGEPGYEQADDRSGSSSTPTQSGHFPVPSGGKQQFHSGYDGRRGSTTRVSTVVEDDEDELEPHEEHVLGHQFENNERMLTPTQELQNMRDLGPDAKSSQQAANLPTPDKQRKHKSNGSSIFGIPKISRWSKTTASSAAPDLSALDSPNAGSAPAYDYKSVSEASRSGSALENYDEGQYRLQDDDRIRSTQSLAREQNRANARGETRSVRSRSSKHTRTPSPLIPSEASSKARDEYDDDNDEYEDDEDDIAFDDPKYQAHRNSLLLEHPQPRAGPTPRHQNTLESQAHTFDDMTGTNSDVSQRTVSDFDPAVWGSSGTAGLARHKLANFEPISPVSMNSPNYARNSKDDGPLVPSQKAPVQPKVYHEPEPEPDWEPQYSNSGFSKGGYYSSPYGSGHLLEPIEEVRYSLETDRSSHRDLSFTPEPQVATTKAIDMRSPTVRKITGPRPMGSRSPAPAQPVQHYEVGGTVRRKPVARSEAGSLDSLDSETF